MSANLLYAVIEIHILLSTCWVLQVRPQLAIRLRKQYSGDVAAIWSVVFLQGLNKLSQLPQRPLCCMPEDISIVSNRMYMVQEGVAAHPKCAVVVTTLVDKDELLRELGNRSSLILECLFEPFASSAPGLIEQIHYWLCVVCKVHSLHMAHSAFKEQRDTCMDNGSA